MGKRRKTSSSNNSDGEKPKTNEDDKDLEKGGKFDKKNRPDGIFFTVNEVPPWYMCILFGFQHYLTMFGSCFAVSILVSSLICVGDDLSRSEILSTVFFASGVGTLLQTNFGTRLPIVQGGTFSFLAPTQAIMSLPQYKCPVVTLPDDFIGNASALLANGTTGIDREVWLVRMREVQGAIILSSLFQIVLGFSGMIGLLLRFIGPLAIAPVITLVGLSLFDAASTYASGHWGISMTMVVLIVVFSQYMSKVMIPCISCTRKEGVKRVNYPIFQLFPVVLSIGLVWLLCYILTITNVFPTDPKALGYVARTDIRTQVLHDASWFRFPRPFQWGRPTFSVSSVFGMLAGVLAGIVESIGDYYACAKLSGAPPPPVHAINRGIGMEGLACLWAGIVGSGNGTTSYSENVGAIGITKVGSRLVVQVGALIIILFSLVGKFGALLTCLPDPVTGGLFFVSFGIIVGVGLSNLSYVDMNSSRNIFILGFSIFSGLSVPRWLSGNPGIIQTGVFELDQIITVLMTTSMFVGGVVAAFLDNTIPGTKEERGMVAWNQQVTTSTGEIDHKANLCYELAPCFACIRKVRCFSFLPFCPTYKTRCNCCKKRKTTDRGEDPDKQEGTDNPNFTNMDNLETTL